jgi:hypothetical protein
MLLLFFAHQPIPTSRDTIALSLCVTVGVAFSGLLNHGLRQCAGSRFMRVLPLAGFRGQSGDAGSYGSTWDLHRFWFPRALSTARSISPSIDGFAERALIRDFWENLL